MRHKVFCKKFKSSCILTVVAALLLSVTLTTATSIHSAHAVTGSQGDLNTAHQKLLAMAFDHCLRGAYMQVANKSNLVDNKKIFDDGIDQWAHYSLYVEKIAGTNGVDNGSIRCGEGNDKLTSGMLSILGISYQDLICDYSDSAKGGLVKIKSGYTCSQALADGNGFDGFKSRNDMRSYFEKLITNSTFSGSDKVPGGSIWTLTPVEEYLTYQEAYLEICANGSAVYGDSASNLRNIIVWNSSTKRFEHAGHSNKRDDNYKVETYEDRDTDVGHSYTCKNLASLLNNPAQSPTKDYINHILNSVKDDCNNKYDEEYDKIKDWVTSNGNSLDGNAEADVSTFLSEYKRNGANKWKLESDGMNVTCNGLDSMKSKWEDIKKTRGLSGAPSIDSGVPYSPSGTVDGDGHTNGETTTCSSASGAVGWFICPILEFAASTSVAIYEGFIEPSLETNPALFKADGEYNGTYQAWQTFRDVANIAFAIFLLFIIFSQVTGIGIDNYGIKKSLPKLIIAVILVNISFYICQFLIDISNIAGSSLYGLINGIGDKITVPAVYGQTLKYASSVTFSIFALVAGGAAVAAFWSAIAGALLAAIPTLIGALVGILFFFFLLGMRQTIVVLLVAISPLAFVCYALPNTKNLFDRWSQLLRSMLILYPICSLMVAGGRLVSKIVLASGGAGSGSSLFFILVAMIAEIGPLFMIPSITRSAFQATGQLGTALSGLRGRMTGGARNIARNNKALQRAVTRNQRNRANSWAARRRVNNYNASAAKNPNNRSLRDRWNLRRGNQEHVAAINQASLAADEERRKIDQMSNAQQVAGLRAGAQLTHAQAVGRNQYLGSLKPNELKEAEKAATTQAATSAEEQNIRNANYGDAEFARAVIRQAETENNSTKERQTLWNRDDYRAGKENANTAALTSELETTRLWTHEDYIKGKLAESDLSREGEQKRAELYANGEYIRSRKNAQQAVISNEITKMFSDKYSRMGIGDIQKELRMAVSDRGKNNSMERFTAATNALVQAGQADKAREVLSGGNMDRTTGKREYADEAEAFGDMVASNKEFRDRAAQVLGSSGEFTFQEYAKHLGQRGEDARSFEKWADATDEYSLHASIQTKGLDRVDKDGFDFLSKHLAALDGASAENISRVAAHTTDAATASKLIQAIERLAEDPKYSTKVTDVIRATSAERAADMNAEVRNALAGIKATDSPDQIYAKNQVWRDQIGDAIRTNPQVAARFTAEFTAEPHGQYFKPEPASSASSTSTPTPPPRSDTPRPPRDTNPDDYSGDGGF